MIRVACTCGKTLTAVDKEAGRPTRCPDCGARVAFSADSSSFEILAPEAATTRERPTAPPLPPPSLRDPDFVPVASKPTPRAATPDDVRRWLAREPWYYGFLASMATVGLFVAVMVSLCACAAGWWFLQGGEGYGPSVGLPVLISAIAGLLLVGLIMGGLLLAVDAVRHLRHIRASTAILAMAAAPPDSHA